MIEYDPIVGIESIAERASRPNPFTLDKDISKEIDGRKDEVVTETYNVANPLLASAVTHAVTKSNPVSMAVGTLVDGHRLGEGDPHVQAMEQIQKEQMLMIKLTNFKV